MSDRKKSEPVSPGRRNFLATAASAVLPLVWPARLGSASRFGQTGLKVWSCGGLAEAFIPANKLYQEQTGVRIAYTGAFAAALGKSLLADATTDVFAGRVLTLAKRLKAAGKMLFFKPLCFTRYVLVTPKGNPAGIENIHDLARPQVKVVLAPYASAPGGKAVEVLLKKAGILQQAMSNAVVLSSCVQRSMQEIVAARGDVSVVEYRLTRMPRFKGKTEIIPINPAYYPVPPLTFTIGVMKAATDKALAEDYLDFILADKGQAFLPPPALSRPDLHKDGSW